MTNTMSCGCEIISDNLGAYKIEYCPKHKATDVMFEALEWLLNDRDSLMAYSAGFKAIVKATGGRQCMI